jgi:hypothetical protein
VDCEGALEQSAAQGRWLDSSSALQDVLGGGEERRCHGARVGHHLQARTTRLPQEEDTSIRSVAAYHGSGTDPGLQHCGVTAEESSFATLFAILSAGRPMQEYRSREELYQFLNVPECPSMHWCHGSGWLMAEHIYDFVKTKQRSMVEAAAFISLSVDETTAVDNSSVIVIHCYVMSNWGRQPLIVALMKLESLEGNLQIDTN